MDETLKILRHKKQQREANKQALLKEQLAQVKAIQNLNTAVNELQKTLENKNWVIDLSQLTEITKQFKNIKTEFNKSNEANLDELAKIITTIKEIKPIVKVPVAKPKIINKQIGSDIFATYIYVDSDEKDIMKYYGYMKPTGAWFIMRTADGEKPRFVTGIADYQKSWLIHKQLTYSYPNGVDFDV